MKKCPKCEVMRPYDQYHKCSRKSDGLATYCKPCEKLRRKKLIEKWQQEPEPTHRVCSHCKIDKDISEYSRNSSYKGGHSHYCKVCVSESWHKNIDVEKRIRYLIQRKKSQCKKANIPFDLTVEDIKIPERCPVLDIPLEFGYDESQKGGKFNGNSPSLDRIIPHLGYVKGNIIVVSRKANTIKNDATIEELERVFNFYKEIM